MLRHYYPRAFEQIACTGIITKACPCRHDIGVRCRSKSRKAWPDVRELLEIGTNRCNRCLLQHDFRQPDMIGVGKTRTRRRAPWERAGMRVIMCQQLPGDIPRIIFGLLDVCHSKWHG